MRKNIKKKTTAKQTSGSGTTSRPWFWIALLCVSSVWMFIFGILVGRGTAPVSMDIKKLQTELAEITHAIQEKDEQELKEYADRIDSKTELEFYEDLKQDEKILYTPGDLKNKSGTDNEIPQKKSLSKLTKRHLLYKRIQSKPESERKKQKPDNLIYRWTIQVSSLKNARAADKMVAALKNQGHPAYKVMAKTHDNGLFYRVRVGPYKDKTLADRNLSAIQQNYNDAILISM